jgi:hypothetical protein
MNHTLPILSVAFGLAIVVPVALAQSTQLTDQKGVTRSEASSAGGPPAPAAPTAQNGQELVARAANWLLVAPGLEAKTRQRVHLFDQKLVGSGTYSQLTNGPKLYLKLDLKLQLSGQARSLRQISDGDSLWEVRSQGSTQTFSHVSLGRLREVAVKTEPAVPPSFWMALGGIPRLMAKLDKQFAFETAQPTTIPTTVGHHPVWRVTGHWRPSLLAKMLPDQKDVILAGQKPRLQDLPEQVPHGVTLVLGRDEIIPLFPYVFSFYRDVVVNQETGEVQRREVVRWELFEVRVRTDLRPGDFDFRPTGQEFQERTEQYVAQLKAAAKRMSNN